MSVNECCLIMDTFRDIVVGIDQEAGSPFGSMERARDDMKLDVALRVVGGHGAVRNGAGGLQDQTYGSPLVIMFGAFCPDQCCRKQQADCLLRPELDGGVPKNSSKLNALDALRVIYFLGEHGLVLY